jgi:hypothetical protein
VSSQLWPPLETIQAALSGSNVTPSGFAELSFLSSDFSPQIGSSHHQDQPMPWRRSDSGLTEVAEDAWMPGSLISIRVGQGKAGVLLDRHLRGERWTGWVTAAEAAWAGAFDVLLEPVDEPFDRQFSVVQTWNPIELECSTSIAWHLTGNVSQQRLTAIRIVAQEQASGLMLSIPSDPGFIALRPAGGVQMVLTGTPLDRKDPRHEYQRLYGNFAARLVAAQLTQRIALRADEPEPQETLPLRKIVDFRARLRTGVLMPQVQPLLRATFSYVVSGPDYDNCYAVKSSNPDMARVMFAQSVLIDKVYEA